MPVDAFDIWLLQRCKNWFVFTWDGLSNHKVTKAHDKCLTWFVIQLMNTWPRYEKGQGALNFLYKYMEPSNTYFQGDLFNFHMLKLKIWTIKWNVINSTIILVCQPESQRSSSVLLSFSLVNQTNCVVSS